MLLQTQSQSPRARTWVKTSPPRMKYEGGRPQDVDRDESLGALQRHAHFPLLPILQHADLCLRAMPCARKASPLSQTTSE